MGGLPSPSEGDAVADSNELAKAAAEKLRMQARHLCDAVASSLGKLSDNHKFIVTAAASPTASGASMLMESSCLWEQNADTACCLSFERESVRLILSAFAVRRE